MSIHAGISTALFLCFLCWRISSIRTVQQHLTHNLSETTMHNTSTIDIVETELTALIDKIKAIPTTEASAAALIEAKDAQIATLTCDVSALQQQLAQAFANDQADITTIQKISAQLDAVIATAAASQAANAEAAPALAAAVASTPTPGETATANGNAGEATGNAETTTPTS